MVKIEDFIDIYKNYCFIGITLQEKFEYTKGVNRSCKWKEDRQYNGQKKKDKKIKTNNTLHRKLKNEQHEPPKKNWCGGGLRCSGIINTK